MNEMSDWMYGYSLFKEGYDYPEYHNSDEVRAGWEDAWEEMYPDKEPPYVRRA